MSQNGYGFAEPQEPPQPAGVCTPAEFTEALRALRTWSGLSYRQLEAKAAAQANALPASTIASTLGRTTLPRSQFVETFTRACGLGEHEILRWLDLRRQITGYEDGPSGDGSGDTSGASPTGPSGKAHASRWRLTASLVGALGVGIVGALGVSSQFHASPTPTSLPRMPVAGLRMLAVGSWARIHPARTPELCVTEGRDRTGRYPTAVAAQRSCTKAGLPQVYLEPVEKDTVQIQWHHPKYGIGCLTVLSKGPARDLLEPRDDCAEGNRAQRFRIERFGPRDTAHFVVHPVITGQCLSLRDQDTEEGTEVVQGRCSGAFDQDFLIELIPPPQTAAVPKASGTG